MTKTRQVGLFAGTYNFPLDAIKVHAKVDFKTRFIRDIKYPITRLMDLLLLSNPEFDEEQITAFMEYVEDGGTVIIFLSTVDNQYQASENLLAALGIDTKSMPLPDRLPIEYTEAYPRPHKRGTKNKRDAAGISRYIKLCPRETAENKDFTPLIIANPKNDPSALALKILFGQGTVVVINSINLVNELYDMFNFLFEVSGTIRENQLISLKNELKMQLVDIIKESFEVYDELPFPVVRRKVDPQHMDLEMDDIDLLLLIEELIREGKVYAKLRGGTLIRY